MITTRRLYPPERRMMYVLCTHISYIFADISSFDNLGSDRHRESNVPLRTIGCSTSSNFLLVKVGRGEETKDPSICVEASDVYLCSL